jgi:hypothetical protein
MNSSPLTLGHDGRDASSAVATSPDAGAKYNNTGVCVASVASTVDALHRDPQVQVFARDEITLPSLVGGAGCRLGGGGACCG